MYSANLPVGQEGHFKAKCFESAKHKLGRSFLNRSRTHCFRQIVCDVQFAEEESGLLSADPLFSVWRTAAATASF